MDSLINVTNNIHESVMSLNLTVFNNIDKLINITNNIHESLKLFVYDYINDVSALNTNAFNNVYSTSMYYVYNTADIVTNAFNITTILTIIL